MTEELVHLGVAHGVATITLDSPANRNALSRQLTQELDERLHRAIADPSARLIVLTGAGTVFCSGADLKEQRAANEAGEATGPGGVAPILSAMWNAPKPVIGRINGPARAGGVGLVAACDIAVASEAAHFAVNEVRIGVIPAIISVVLVPRIGATKAMELFLTGEQFDAHAALALGLVNAVARAEELDAAVARYVEGILKGAPSALAGAKQLIRDVPTMPMEAAFTEMAARSAAFFGSEEAREGMTAFAEKRPPRWQA